MANDPKDSEKVGVYETEPKKRTSPGWLIPLLVVIVLVLVFIFLL